MFVLAFTFGFASIDFLRGFDCFGALVTNASVLPISADSWGGTNVLDCGIMLNDFGRSIGSDGCWIVVFLGFGPGFKPVLDVCFDPGFGPGFCFTLTVGICEAVLAKLGICISGACMLVGDMFAVIEILGVIVN